MDECHRIKHPQLSSVYAELVNKLYKEYLAKRTSANNCSDRYVQRLYSQSRVAAGESYSFKGIFLTYAFLLFIDG